MYHARHSFIVNITQCGTDVNKADGVVVPHWAFSAKAAKDKCRNCKAYFDLDEEIRMRVDSGKALVRGSRSHS